MGRDYRAMVLVDFDGVIHSYTSGWKGADVIPDEPVPGAIYWLGNMVQYSDYDIGIFSARNHQEGGPEAIRAYLMDNICEIYGLEDGTEIVKRIKIVMDKPPEAIVLLDDRAMTFRGTFPSIIELQNFKPWYK